MVKAYSELELFPIGVIHSEFEGRLSAPRQGFESDSSSVMEIFPSYMEGMAGVTRGYLLDVIFWMDKSDRSCLFNERKNRGVFATRSPDRPNPLGVSTVEVSSINGNCFTVRYLDAIDGSLIVDIKHSLVKSVGYLKNGDISAGE